MDTPSGLISIRILAIARDETEAHELRVLQDRFQAAQPQPGCSMGGVEDACGRAAESSTAVQARASASDESLHRWSVRGLAKASFTAEARQGSGEKGGSSMEGAGGSIGVRILVHAGEGAAEDGGCMLENHRQATQPMRELGVRGVGRAHSAASTS